MSVFHFVGARAWMAGIALVVHACAPSVEHRPSALLDDFGDSIRVGPPPARIVSLSPATTEILFALGAGPRLVGRTHWDTHPDSARMVPDLGNGLRPNVEAILAARPDLVVLYASTENRDAARALRAAGSAVVAIRMDRVSDFSRATTLLGAMVHDSVRARAVIDSVTGTLTRVRTATAALPHPTVFIPFYEQPLLTIGGGSFLSELVQIAGARNLFADLSAPSPQVAFEEVLRRQPDFILTGPHTMLQLRADRRWRALSAMRDGHLLIMDTSLVQLPGVRLGEAAVSLARLFHPDVKLEQR